MRFFRKKINVRIPENFTKHGNNWSEENTRILRVFLMSETGRLLMLMIYRGIMEFCFSKESTNREVDGVRKGMIIIAEKILTLAGDIPDDFYKDP